MDKLSLYFGDRRLKIEDWRYLFIRFSGLFSGLYFVCFFNQLDQFGTLKKEKKKKRKKDKRQTHAFKLTCFIKSWESQEINYTSVLAFTQWQSSWQGNQVHCRHQLDWVKLPEKHYLRMLHYNLINNWTNIRVQRTRTKQYYALR